MFGFANCYVCRYEVCEPWSQIGNVSAFFHCIRLIQAIFTIMMIMMIMMIMIIVIIVILIIFNISNILAKFVLKDTWTIFMGLKSVTRVITSWGMIGCLSLCADYLQRGLLHTKNTHCPCQVDSLCFSWYVRYYLSHNYNEQSTHISCVLERSVQHKNLMT